MTLFGYDEENEDRSEDQLKGEAIRPSNKRKTKGSDSKSARFRKESRDKRGGGKLDRSTRKEYRWSRENRGKSRRKNLTKAPNGDPGGSDEGPSSADSSESSASDKERSSEISRSEYFSWGDLAQIAATSPRPVKSRALKKMRLKEGREEEPKRAPKASMEERRKTPAKKLMSCGKQPKIYQELREQENSRSAVGCLRIT